jgi:uncharacterized protein DUF4232
MTIESPPRPPTQDELDALIREARQRQLRRRLVGVAFVALAASAALAIHSVLASSGKASASSGQSRGLVLSACRMPNFAINEIPISGADALDRFGLQFTNQSSSPCRLDGYPVLRFSDSKGVIPFLVRYLGKLRAVTVPGRHAIFTVFSKFRCDIGVSRSTIKTTIGFPGQRQGSAALTSRLGGPSICKPGIPSEGRWVTVTPFQSLRAAYSVSLIGNGTGP